MSTDYLLRQISGWEFHDLGLKIQRYLCEALYAAGRAREAGYYIIKTIKASREEDHMGGPTTEWAIGELMLYLFYHHGFNSLQQILCNDISPFLKAVTTQIVRQPAMTMSRRFMGPSHRPE